MEVLLLPASPLPGSGLAAAGLSYPMLPPVLGSSPQSSSRGFPGSGVRPSGGPFGPRERWGPCRCHPTASEPPLSLSLPCGRFCKDPILNSSRLTH